MECKKTPIVPNDGNSKRTQYIYELYKSGMDFKDIAAHIGKSMTTVYSHINRAKKRDSRPDGLKLSTRATYALRNWNICYLEDLVSVPLSQLERIPNLGKVSIDEVKREAKKMGVELLDDRRSQRCACPACGRR
mgnify:CR=1 FL=1